VQVAKARGIYVQYGCGRCAPDAWLNFDASPRLRVERIPGLRELIRLTGGLIFPSNIRPGDIVQGLPIADGSAAGVYCSHVLEHLPRADLPVALRNTLRMLRPGGLFRLVVPDLRWRAERYLMAAARGEAAAADAFLDACLLGERAKPRTLAASIRRRWSRNAHCWMYDFAALATLLEEAGFIAIRQCDAGDCCDPMFALVEEHDRFFESGRHELAIEAARPA
jgi:SAM-dependent methyltransferase